jgi:hypothetical protein
MITLDGYEATGLALVLLSLLWVAFEITHLHGLHTQPAEVATRHDRCEGCGRDVCGCDPDHIVVHGDTVLLGCFHGAVLCIDCAPECPTCRTDFAIDAYVWGDRS